MPNEEFLPGDETLMLLARELQEAVAGEMVHSSTQEVAVAAMHGVVAGELAGRDGSSRQ